MLVLLRIEPECSDWEIDVLRCQQLNNLLLILSLIKFINKPTHKSGHFIDWVVVRPDDDIHRNSNATDSLESDH